MTRIKENDWDAAYEAKEEVCFIYLLFSLLVSSLKGASSTPPALWLSDETLSAVS